MCDITNVYLWLQYFFFVLMSCGFSSKLPSGREQNEIRTCHKTERQPRHTYRQKYVVNPVYCCHHRAPGSRGAEACTPPPPPPKKKGVDSDIRKWFWCEEQVPIYWESFLSETIFFFNSNHGRRGRLTTGVKSGIQT